MKRSSLQHLDCSIAQSLDLVGEWWTLLVVRDVFFGLHRFDAIRDDLGISRNILTDRLNTLVDGGVLERRPIDGGHHEYHLTEKGRDLYPVLIAIMQWGDKWAAPNGAPRGRTMPASRRRMARRRFPATEQPAQGPPREREFLEIPRG